MNRLVFTNHVLFVASRQLFREGAAVHLSPKSMDLLLRLATAPERYHTKDELQEALWPGLHVGSTSLPGLVKELRRALGDTSDPPRLVRTLHGRGYQFVAPVGAAEGPQQGPSELAHAPSLADTAVSLPADFSPELGELTIVTLWPPGGATLELEGHGSFVLGRAAECALLLPHEKVSRRHAEVSRRGPVWVLRDLGSTNGSYVDRERVREGAVLRSGQLLRLGEWLGLLQAGGRSEVPSSLRALVAAQDWRGRVRELESACAGQLGLAAASHDGTRRAARRGARLAGAT